MQGKSGKQTGAAEPNQENSKHGLFFIHNRESSLWDRQDFDYSRRSPDFENGNSPNTVESPRRFSANKSPVILTHLNLKRQNSLQDSSSSSSLEAEAFNPNFSFGDENGNGNDSCSHSKGDKLGGGGHPNPWNKIFQCFTFNVFNKGGTKEGRLWGSGSSHGSFSFRKDDAIGNENQGGHVLEDSPKTELPRTMTEVDLYLLDLADRSEILERGDAKQLSPHLPPRAIGYDWELIFSTTGDGFSLHTLYRKMEGIESPVLFLVQDSLDRVFGGMLSCAFKVSENFYGNCDTFLFRCRPDFQVFKWSGNNFYFIQGQDSFISVGSDDGRFGIWLDDNLFIGRTENCSTFDSPPLVPEKDFKVKTVECWTVSLV